MSRISQIQLRYLPVEDRILLRLNTTAQAELRFWITRRFAHELVGELDKLLLDTASEEYTAQDQNQQQAPDKQKAVMSFQHQAAVQQANLSQPFKQEARHFPMGQQPLLLNKAVGSRTEKGIAMLSLQPPQGKGIDLTLQPQLLHSVCKLLNDALKASDWGIRLDIPDVEEVVQTSEKRVLN